MFAKFLKLFILHPKSTFFGTLFLCIFLSFFAFKLDIDASAESLLLENDPDLKTFREISKNYKNDNFLLLAFKPYDEKPFSKQNLAKLTKLHQALEQAPLVERVFSIINAPLLQSSQNTDLKKLLDNIPNITSKDINLTKAQNEIINSPFYKNNIISKDAKITGLIIYLQTDEVYNKLIEKRDLTQDETEKNQIRLAIKEHQNKQKVITKHSLDTIKNIIKDYQIQGDALYLGGVSMIADDMINYIKSDLLIYGVLLVFLLGLALYYFFRSYFFVFLALFICFISLSAASGLFTLLKFQITVISSNYVALLLIITLSIVVHLITHFIQISTRYTKASIQNLVLQTLLAKAKPSLYAIITTMIGFLSLIFSHIEPIIKLGMMMSIGIVLALILSYLFLASILVLTKPKISHKKEIRLNFLIFCAKTSLDSKKRYIIYGICIFVIILALFGISKLRVENSFVNYFKDSSDIKKGLLVIDKNLGGTLPLEVIVEFKKNTNNQNTNDTLDSFENEFDNLAKEDTYWFDSEKIRIAQKVHNFLEKQEFVGSVLSLNSLLSLGKKINNGKDLDDFTLAFLNENLPSQFKQDLLSPFVNIKHNQLRFNMRIVDSNPYLKRNEFLIKLKKQLHELLKDDGVIIQVTGIMVLYNNMLQSLFSSQFDTLAFVILAIFILFIIVFKDLKFSLIAILVNVIPLSLVFALMGFFNIPLDMMSITIAAISIGIGIDDAIHYIYRFKEEIKKNNIKQAIINSHLSIGSALYYTTISIVLGFSVMMSSNFIPTIYFGILTVFVMILLLSGSLFLLPSFLISFYSQKAKG
ncbi:MMPL family transporter [Campylobacter hepaticus]|uniref:MMPL family transporter n=1 Tax=Campylobacter hepaticus TaxID=1813019 RepID=A0A6A7JSW4_9BACT|nr:MMPL family transporter [Campylobacter hepaticus]AXP08993.1 RND family transporter [Campylobacter hepaticus]MCZ0771967.1 MMPL family transporter [Campylobacter hepaticus]MCZ0773436.1 MMPL family transporter [Campylobacter hepaticus]MCZ0774686.1 MMPL family transporter [Campylobacter hepaticus]MPV54568.1 MMPL family transporter [Campylobacter hepaticus]